MFHTSACYFRFFNYLIKVFGVDSQQKKKKKKKKKKLKFNCANIGDISIPPGGILSITIS